MQTSYTVAEGATYTISDPTIYASDCMVYNKCNVQSSFWSYSWVDYLGSAGARINSYSVPGTYSVTYIAIGPSDCSDSYTFTV